MNFSSAGSERKRERLREGGREREMGLRERRGKAVPSYFTLGQRYVLWFFPFIKKSTTFFCFENSPSVAQKNKKRNTKARDKDSANTSSSV